MGAYYYLLASLPSLEFNAPPPLSHEEFLALCEPWAPARDLTALAAASVEPPDPDPLSTPRGPLGPVSSFVRGFAWEAALIRAGRLGRQPPPEPSGPMDPDARRLAASLFASGADPLETEIRFSRALWDFLEDLALGHDFDAFALMIYGCKLLILARTARFDARRGGERLVSLAEGLIHGS